MGIVERHVQPTSFFFLDAAPRGVGDDAMVGGRGENSRNETEVFRFKCNDATVVDSNSAGAKPVCVVDEQVSVNIRENGVVARRSQ